MGYFGIYEMLLESVFLLLVLTPFVPVLRRKILDHQKNPPLDLEPFEFYIELLAIMDKKIEWHGQYQH